MVQSSCFYVNRFICSFNAFGKFLQLEASALLIVLSSSSGSLIDYHLHTNKHAFVTVNLFIERFGMSVYYYYYYYYYY